MSSPRTPKLRRHKTHGLGVVTLGGRDVYLGKWPEGSRKPPAEVQAAYNRLIAEWLTSGGSSAPARPEEGLTVNELIRSFMVHADRHYRHPDGTPTSELADFKLSLRPLRVLYGFTLAAEFGPLALKAVRQALISGSWLSESEQRQRRAAGHKIGCCRTVVNQRVNRIKRMFKWAVSEELVPPSALHGLQAVRGLERGRTEAAERDPVGPVPVAFVEATLPFLLAPVQTMVQLQQLTGMRPGEVCIMRTADLDTAGDVWFFRPAQHKTAWRGKARVIALGPKAQEVLRPWLRLALQEFLFQPREAMDQRRVDERRRRKSRVQPSQLCRKKKRPKKVPGERYTTGTYGRAIADACKRAGVPSWAPNQLRHTFATEVRRRFGLEAAQVSLGHAKADVTQVYAERDLDLAAKIAAEVG